MAIAAELAQADTTATQADTTVEQQAASMAEQSAASTAVVAVASTAVVAVFMVAEAAAPTAVAVTGNSFVAQHTKARSLERAFVFLLPSSA
jgi:nucleoside phosphorylase